MNPKLPINLDFLLHHRTIESERVEYKAGWNPEAVLHCILPSAMMLSIWVGVMWRTLTRRAFEYAME
tara:strand:- start:6126 stop:6326 length:201 start_codon:yes stop_codon:yes gene_type:complete